MLGPTDLEKDFKRIFELLSFHIHYVAVQHGFWDKERNDGEMIALMHSELSEALESIRHEDPPSDHIPEFSGAEEEFADCIIRIMDMAHARNLRVAEAIIAKIEYNEGRSHMHGKKF